MRVYYICIKFRSYIESCHIMTPLLESINETSKVSASDMRATLV